MGPLDRACDLAVANVGKRGGPFGAVLVTADGVEFPGTNRVTASNDPTAHAEVSAIRHACAAIGSHDLTGAVLYSSCEPCPMCLTAALWANLTEVVYAATRDDAAAAGFGDAAYYDYVNTPDQSRMFLTHHPLLVGGTAPFEAWEAHTGRVTY